MKIPADKNLSVAELQKLSKYNDLGIEVEKLGHMKTVKIPVAIRDFGMISNGTEKNLEYQYVQTLLKYKKQHLQALLISYKKPYLCKKIQQYTTEAMMNVYVLNKNLLITHHIYIYTLYLHSL